MDTVSKCLFAGLGLCGLWAVGSALSPSWLDVVDALAATSHSDEKIAAFPMLGSEASGLQDASGNVANWRIEASVLRENGEYTYKYIFKNKGDGPILMGLMDDAVVRPKSEALSCPVYLAPKESKTIQFSASDPPALLVTPVRVAVWSPETIKWTFLASGKVAVYVPSVGD